MSDVIGETHYPKVRVLSERDREKIENKINDLVARGFELRGQVDAKTENENGIMVTQFTATMVRES
jgi:hypothetical protein